MKNAHGAMVAALATAMTACSAPGSTTSTIHGTLDTSTFPSAPTSLEVVNEQADATQIAIGAHGEFTMNLAPGHSYRLNVSMATGSEPVVFPRAGGKLELGFKIVGGGATVDLGAVHHHQLVASRVHPYSLNTGAQNGGDGECVDGVLSGTQTPCADEATQSCTDGGESSDNGDSSDGADGGVDCQDGLDPQGNACDGGPAANGNNGSDPSNGETNDGAEADPAEAMAIPEHSLGQVTGCGDSSDSDGDAQD